MKKGSACTFQVPLYYNDGREVEPEVILEIKQTLDRQFGGYTILGIDEGSWFGQVERSLRIEVAVPKKRIAELRKVVITIGKKLGQKAMYFNAPPPSVEIIDIEEQDE
jgi:hypothetical protein